MKTKSKLPIAIATVMLLVAAINNSKSNENPSGSPGRFSLSSDVNLMAGQAGRSSDATVFAGQAG